VGGTQKRRVGDVGEGTGIVRVVHESVPEDVLAYPLDDQSLCCFHSSLIMANCGKRTLEDEEGVSRDRA
jgi:hypothetical protein